MVRETRLPAPQRKGFRTTTITVVSSFLVAGEKTVAELADDFMRRWKVELYFDYIKTSQAMDVLRTKSPELICRELLMHMIAYNHQLHRGHCVRLGSARLRRRRRLPHRCPNGERARDEPGNLRC